LVYSQDFNVHLLILMVQVLVVRNGTQIPAVNGVHQELAQCLSVSTINVAGQTWLFYDK
jgi:hypothetical protein